MTIAAGQPIKASEVNAEFEARERHSNKVTALSASVTDTQYPSAKAVYNSLTTGLAAKQDKIAAGTANNIVAYSGTAGTLNTLTRVTSVRAAAAALDTAVPTEKAVANSLAAVTTSLAAKEDAGNKKTAISSTASDTEYPSARAVYTALAAKADSADVQARLPVGTILMYDGTGWKDNETLVGWYQCNGKNGTPDLRDLFIRGGKSGEDMARGGTGGADSQEIEIGKDNLPKHTHALTGTKVTANTAGSHKHGLLSSNTNFDGIHGFMYPYTGSHKKVIPAGIAGSTASTEYYEQFYRDGTQTVKVDVMSTAGGHSHTVSGTTDDNSSAQNKITVSTVPGYYALIYIKKMA
ncbi:MAG: hypothetical protein LBQ83_08335 [Candidatus Margulisbacteria bacterium]|jgi:hypothetical protein|nr:hypothetical protein [Candidatus Margulisiibacteriota bacterium]